MDTLRNLFSNSEFMKWVAIAIFAMGFALIVRAVLNFILTHAKRLNYRLRGQRELLIASMLSRTWMLFLFVGGLVIASFFTSYGRRTGLFINKAFQVTLLLQIGAWVAAAIEGFEVRLKNGRAAASTTAVGLVKISLKFTVYICVFLASLHTLGINITAFVAGLGVSGIAVALAVQNILGDLFASLSIVLDRPFEVGDFIASGSEMGTIEKVGLKTTRVRSLTGEQLIFPNSNLLQSRLRNYHRMRERRVSFILTVGFKTTIENLRRIPDIIREAITAESETRFERCHFSRFADTGYEYETVYWVNQPDHGLHMDIQQRVFLRICEGFEREGIRFARPQRELYLQAASGVEAAEGFMPSLRREDSDRGTSIGSGNGSS